MSRLAPLALCAFVAAPAWAELDAEVFARYRPAIVRVKVDGRKQGGGTCSNVGTGFFVDEYGHILTAGHTVQPCGSNSLGTPQWASPPTIRADLVVGPGANLREEVAILIYEDRQTDLALLRVNALDTQPLPLAQPGTLDGNDDVALMTLQQGLSEPAQRNAHIDSPFNPTSRHDGLIDISASDVVASASGSPLFDRSDYVAGVFTKGVGTTGEGAVPISFAAPLLHIAGVSYPSHEVREVIDELRKDLVEWALYYDPSTENLTVNYKKRLRSGTSPVKFTAEFRVFTKGSVLGPSVKTLTVEDTVVASPVLGKEGRVVFGAVGEKIDQEIQIRNQHADTQGRERLGAKDYAEVTLEVEFSEGASLTPVRGERVDFE